MSKNQDRKICPKCLSKQEMKYMKKIRIPMLNRSRYFCNYCISGITGESLQRVKENDFVIKLVLKNNEKDSPINGLFVDKNQTDILTQIRDQGIRQ